jgi:hypothetical protein
MQLPAEETVSYFLADPEMAAASFSGSVTDVLVHPQRFRKFLPYLIKTVLAGYLIATYVSPAIAERFNLTEKEALAASFVVGYAGIRILNNLEKVVEEELKKRMNSKTQSITTDSSNDSEDSAS